MKTLEKIKLRDVTILNDKEMKMVVGGSGGGSGTISLCDPIYKRKICKKQSDCTGNFVCIGTPTGEKCCF